MRILDSETYAGQWHYGKRNCFTGKINDRDYWLTFEVPAIISEEVWKRAQIQRKLNTSESKRNIKREYLLRGRVKCGLCKSSVNCYATKPNERKVYLYYRCNGYMGNIANVSCSLPSFQVGVVDALVWEWVKTLLTDAHVLETGLVEYQENREQFLGPMRDRLVVLEDLWGDSKSQLDRMLDLYVSGQIPKELLLEKKQRLDSTLAALEKEREELSVNMEAQSLSENEIQQIWDFAAQVAEGLNPGNESFEDRRQVIELLDVRANLTEEDGEKYVDVWCFLGRKKLSLVEPTSRNGGRANGRLCCIAKSRRQRCHTCRRAPSL